MAAFVVAPPSESRLPRVGRRLDIFPGSATPSVFSADAPFWIGYGFVPDPGDSDRGVVDLEAETRFELEVDGEPVTVQEDVSLGGGQAVSKRCVANFESGLPVGWHRFAGRWYDAGALILTSERSIQFIER
jgi:hypothetical protein